MYYKKEKCEIKQFFDTLGVGFCLFAFVKSHFVLGLKNFVCHGGSFSIFFGGEEGERREDMGG